MSEWAGVRGRIAALAAGENTAKVHGARRHAFALNPVLAPAEMADLDANLGIRLPGDYRSFLLEVGNGPAGPDYGLEPVQRVDGVWRWQGSGSTVEERLSTPFRSNATAVGVHTAAEPKPDQFPDRDAFYHAYGQWEARGGEVGEEESYGAIALAHQGCGHYWLLVVTGAERGTMWEDCRAADIPLAPATDAGGKPLTFRCWYLEWLGRAEGSEAYREVGEAA